VWEARSRRESRKGNGDEGMEFDVLKCSRDKKQGYGILVGFEGVGRDVSYGDVARRERMGGGKRKVARGV